jgi:diguanylate cyclase (GGDEF)-like protein
MPASANGLASLSARDVTIIAPTAQSTGALAGSPEVGAVVPTIQMNGRWAEIVSNIEPSFQPIVSTQSGISFGVEALIGNSQDVGFACPEDLLEAAFLDGALVEVELSLCERAIAKFLKIEDHINQKLFLNLDSRALAAGPTSARLNYIVRRFGLPANTVVIEISERHSLGTPGQVTAIHRALRRHGFSLAIDDFGIGFSGLQMLYAFDSDLIKIDRFFLHGVALDAKKRLFLSQIVSVARLLGILVVAEGIEAEADLLACLDIGVDLVQGYLIRRPAPALTSLEKQYAHIYELGRKWKRRKDSDEWIIREQIDYLEPVRVDTGMLKLFEHFRTNKTTTFFPVVDAMRVPVGIVREQDLKDYTYAHYGRSLIENRSLGRRLHQFVIKCPIADINTDAEKILQNFAAEKASEGIIIVEDMKYIGFLSADALLRVLNDKKIAAARDQSPLTKLPGNGAIHEYVGRALDDVERPYALCYLDFDFFKPFNDRYGFRVGDRAILMFSEMMQKTLSFDGAFIGHVGGDDFFFALGGWHDFDGPAAIIKKLIDTFSQEAASLYDDDARRQGYITATDRLGEPRRFPLLSVSAALVNLPANRGAITADELSRFIASLKSDAKKSAGRLCAATLLGRGPGSAEELVATAQATRAGNGQVTPVPANPQ